jgi:DNA-binding winged helix-turn-helix (wHTH) protein
MAGRDLATSCTVSTVEVGGKRRGNSVSSGGTGEPVRFGAFAVDLLRRQVVCSDEEVHLTPKAFDLLALLIAEAPRVVTKTELHDRLWPGSFVSDATLVGLVKELRRALDDRDPGAPIIRTAHRIGYAFCPRIEVAPSQTPRIWHCSSSRGVASTCSQARTSSAATRRRQCTSTRPGSPAVTRGSWSTRRACGSRISAARTARGSATHV